MVVKLIRSNGTGGTRLDYFHESSSETLFKDLSVKTL